MRDHDECSLRSQVVTTTSPVTMQTRASSPPVIENILSAIMERMVDSSRNDSSRNTGECVVVGLGGNQGQVVHTFREAARRLQDFAAVEAFSSLYRSFPIGPVQPDFLNAAIGVRYAGPLEELLSCLQKIESDLGRVRTVRWGARTLDLDILWAGERRQMSSSLTVPHSQLRFRAFALRPLLDIDPAANDPDDGSAYSLILASLNDQGLQKIQDSSWWTGA